jgi:hypothetical protein
MGTDYPEHLPAREPAPPYDGEGPFALWHFSEDPSLGRFRPRASAANRIRVMEAGWLGRMRECRLYAYRLPAGPFRPHDVGGYWIAGEQVDAVDQVIIDDLAGRQAGRHASAGIELRVTPSIWPFWRRAADSTVGFSGSRLRNSAPHPDRFG